MVHVGTSLQLCLIFQGFQQEAAQSIIGATEKRRESGAGVLKIGDIGVENRCGWEVGGVYQE